MHIKTRRNSRGNIVSWNVIRLDDIVYVGIVKVSPTTKLNIQFVPRHELLPADNISIERVSVYRQGK